MDHYTNLINSITSGHHNPLPNQLSEDAAKDLLTEAVKFLQLRPLRNNNWENDKYFVYVGSFPSYHLAIANRTGTILKYTITSIEQLKKVPK